jgi:hypothetical protein
VVEQLAEATREGQGWFAAYFLSRIDADPEPWTLQSFSGLSGKILELENAGRNGADPLATAPRSNFFRNPLAPVSVGFKLT